MKSAVTGILVLFGLTSLTYQALGSACLATPQGGINFSMSSKKNSTGHWNAVIHLRHGSNPLSHEQETGAWNVDVIQTSEKCGQWEAVDIFSLSAPPARGGPGYDLVPGLGYYKHHLTTKTWAEAREACQQEGAHLAVINSEAELRALQGIYSLHPNIEDGVYNNFAHVGFHDLYVEGQYITIFGDSLETAGYSKFASSDPNGGRNENCGFIGRTQELYDGPCQWKLSFFCEQELN